MAKECLKYLYQYIESKGNAVVKLDSMFSKLIALLSNFKGFWRKDRVKIFQVFMSQKINQSNDKADFDD